MKKIISVITLVMSLGFIMKGEAQQTNSQCDSTCIMTNSEMTKPVDKAKTTTSTPKNIDLTELKGNCQPGPDGWIHVYGDKTGCADDLHLQCSYSSVNNKYYISKAVYGCFTKY